MARKIGLYASVALWLFFGCEGQVEIAPISMATVDAGNLLPDAGLELSDSGLETPDAGSVTVDAGNDTPDAGALTPDAGNQTPDGGAPQPDAGTQDPDAGTAMPDGGTLPDAGDTNPDAGHQTPDAGMPSPDAGTETPDAGATMPDGGTPQPDSGTENPDAGTLVPDGGALNGEVTLTPIDQTHLPGDLGLEADIIRVSYAGLSPARRDWISIVPVGGTDRQKLAYGFVTASSGVMNFVAPKKIGSYEYRAYATNFYLPPVAVSSPISIAFVGQVSSNKSIFAVGENVTATFSALPAGSRRDWISIAPEDASVDEFGPYVTVPDGQTDGTLMLNGPTTAGTYVIRVFRNDTFQRIAESAPFAVR
jgi:hypothetical protein